MGTAQISIDMSTLPRWANVTAGSHTLTVKAKADGYTTSDASAGAAFTKYDISLGYPNPHLTLSPIQETETNLIFTLQPDVGYIAQEDQSGINIEQKSTGALVVGWTYEFDSATGAGTITVPKKYMTEPTLVYTRGVARTKYTLSIVLEHCKTYYARINRYVNGVLTAVDIPDKGAIYGKEVFHWFGEAEDGYQSKTGKTSFEGETTVGGDLTLSMKFPDKIT